MSETVKGATAFVIGAALFALVGFADYLFATWLMAIWLMPGIAPGDPTYVPAVGLAMTLGPMFVLLAALVAWLAYILGRAVLVRLP